MLENEFTVAQVWFRSIEFNLQVKTPTMQSSDSNGKSVGEKRFSYLNHSSCCKLIDVGVQNFHAVLSTVCSS